MSIPGTSTSGVRFEPFKMDSQWKTFKDHFNFCLKAKQIENDQDKCALFFTVCSETLHELVVTLITPKETTQVNFNEVLNTLDSHFKLKPSEIVKSFKFNQRSQKLEESINDYFKELQKIAMNCKFCTSLECMLRDRLVADLRDKGIQHVLLAKTGTTYKAISDATLAAEVASKDVSQLGSDGNNTQVYNLKADYKRKNEPAIYSVFGTVGIIT
ncbi:uncharacterized protein [Centruroides vittatus]|uniref:uncharacterized protein n=1 Tax=Centruroides vittatus TaxID=120091 RepID=UPI00350F0A80